MLIGVLCSDKRMVFTETDKLHQLVHFFVIMIVDDITLILK